MHSDDRTEPGRAATARRFLRLTDLSPGQADLLKTAALVLMVADHVSLTAGLDCSWMRLAGRGAFPLFALVWGMHMARTPQVSQRAVSRLWVWACISQAGWWLAGMNPAEGNILFAFAVSGLAVRLTQRYGTGGGFMAAGLILLWTCFSASSYGLPGVLTLMLSYGLFSARQTVLRSGCALLLLPAMVALNADHSLAFSLAGLVIPCFTLITVNALPGWSRRFWPRDFFPLFYAVHLAVLGILFN